MEKKGFWSKLSKKIKIVLALIGIVATAILLYIAYDALFVDKGHKVTTISESSLEQIIQIEELSTTDYIYNSIATAYLEDGQKVKYYVAYEGNVKAGINFSKIEVSLDEENKKISIKLPEVEIQDIIVDIESLDFIFTKDKYNTQTELQAAYKLCVADLESKVGNENALFVMAKENARLTVEALIAPWIKQVDDEYFVEIK